MVRVIGIDPGLSGAIAFYDGVTLQVEDMPTVKAKTKGNDLNVVGLVDIIEDMWTQGPTAAYIERVSAMPGQGVSSMFKFGRVFGNAEALILAFRIPINYISPSKWKMEWGLTGGKEKSRARALEWFPQYSDLFARKKDDGRAEAALIARYGYLLETKGTVR